MLKCEECEKEFQNYSSLGSHIGQSHRALTLKGYYDKYLKKDIQEGICKNLNCKKPTKFVGLTIGYNNHCSRKCANTMLKVKPKTKKNINLKCEICGKVCENIKGLSHHISSIHKEGTVKDYYDKYLKINIDEGICKKCGNPTRFLGLNGYSQFCSYEYSIKEKKTNNHKKIICQICGKKYESYKALGIHIVQFHGKGKIKAKAEYYNKYLKKDSSEGICIICLKPTNFVSLNYGYYKHCSTKCSQQDPEVQQKSIETCLKNHGVTNFAKTEKWLNQMSEGGQAAYMLTFIQNPSKPQKEIFEKVKILFSDAIMNLPILNYCADIAIPSIKLVIEYNGEYWHREKEDYDFKRKESIEKEGWKVLIYSGVKGLDIIPSKEQIKNDITNIFRES